MRKPPPTTTRTTPTASCECAATLCQYPLTPTLAQRPHARCQRRDRANGTHHVSGVTVRFADSVALLNPKTSACEFLHSGEESGSNVGSVAQCFHPNARRRVAN